MITGETSQPRPDGGLLLATLLVACLATVPRAQPDSGAVLRCDAIRAAVDDSNRFTLDNTDLNDFKNGVEELVNCLPANSVVEIVALKLTLEDVVEIKKPIAIEGGGALVQCLVDSKKGAFKIRSDDVTISNLVFKACNSSAPVGLIDVKNSQNVILRDVQFLENNNTAGPAGLSVVNSKIKLRNVEARNNAGLLGGFMSAKKGSKMSIADSDFSGNEALEKGGAVHLHDSAVKIADTTFKNNRASDVGGAVFAEGVVGATIALKNVVFVGNELQGEYGKDSYFQSGGAMALMGPKLKADIKESTFTRNSAVSFGGALGLLDVTTASIIKSTFFGNSAGAGGAVSVESLARITTKLEVRGTTFESNSAGMEENDAFGDGGAILLWGSGISATFIDASFLDNRSGAGGAVAGLDIRRLDISGGTFNKNQALELQTATEGDSPAGGAVFIHSFGKCRIKIVDSAFEGNSAMSGVDLITASGGGLYLCGDGLQASIQNSTFEKNDARDFGGGVFGFNISELEISNTWFLENRAGVDHPLLGSLAVDEILMVHGGAVALEFVANVSVNKSIFLRNSSKGDGGGLFTFFSMLLVIRESRFESNFATAAAGALTISFSNATILNSTFVGNGAGRTGGAIGSLHATSLVGPDVSLDEIEAVRARTVVQISESVFRNNTAENGGAVDTSGAMSYKICESKFLDNVARLNGGAFRSIGVDLLMESCLYRNNSAGANGGAIELNRLEGSIPNVTITSGIFSSNNASLGGAIYLVIGQLTMAHCEFDTNIALDGGGAVYAQHRDFDILEVNKESNVTALSSSFSGNKAERSREGGKIPGKGGAVMISGVGLTAWFTNCNFSKNMAGSGGSLYIQDVQQMAVEDSAFSDGFAVTGGALTAINVAGYFSMHKVSFSRNLAKWGGAVFLSSLDGDRFDRFLEGAVRITEAHFFRNVASKGGGAIDSKGKELQCFLCHFDSNTAGVGEITTAVGGAIRAQTNLLLINSTITGCTASQSGGGVYIEDAIFDGVNVTVVNNTAGTVGGGFATNFGPVFAVNDLYPWRCRACTVSENKARRGGGMHFYADESVEAFPCLPFGDTLQTNFAELLTDCFPTSSKSDLVELPVVLTDTSFKRNEAQESGSHIFLGNFKKPICCGGKCWTLTSKLNEALELCGLKDAPLVKGGKSDALGTSFQTARISPSHISGHASGKELPPIQVRILDSFGQNSVQNATLKLEFTTLGGEIFGSPVTSEGVLMSGEISVTGIVLRALPGNYNLSFEVTSMDGNRVVKQFLSVDVRECVIGEVSREGGLRCDRCGDEFFSFDVTDEQCTPCPMEKARCSGATLVPLDGYWHSEPTTSEVHACLSEEACTYENRTERLFAESVSSLGSGVKLGSSTSSDRQCAKGHKDVLCGSCEPSHGKSRWQCRECQGKVTSGLFIGIATLALAVLSLIYVKSAAKFSEEIMDCQSSTVPEEAHVVSNVQGHVLGESSNSQKSLENVRKRERRASDIFKIVVNFLQVTGSAAAINVDWTKSMLAVLITWDVISGVTDSNSFFPFECAFSTGKNSLPRSIKATILVAFLPAIVWATFAIIRAGYAWRKKTSIQECVMWSYVAVLAVLQASYISVTRTFVRIFYCVDASPVEGWFWVQDTSVMCYQGSHAFLVGFVGAPGLLFISLGFPCWLLFKLTRKDQSRESVRRYRFLYRAYKEEVAAWEVVILVRKALLSTIVVFGRALGGEIQTSLALFVMVVSIVLQMHYRPFLEWRLNILELGSLAISTLAFIIGNLVNQDEMTNGGRVIMSIIFIGVVGFYVSYIIKQIFDMGFSKLRDWMENEAQGSQQAISKYGLLKIAIARQFERSRATMRKTNWFV